MTVPSAREILDAVAAVVSAQPGTLPLTGEDIELAIRAIVREEIRNTSVSAHGDLIPDLPDF